MKVLDTSGFSEILADERMLEPEQYEEFVNSMLPICQDVIILAKELVYRGWLFPYQVEQILAGRGHNLMLGSYVLLEPLGEGGMGRVYKARNWKLNRIVAVKVIRDEQSHDPAVIARFQREIRALGRIRHPNIVKAVDADFRLGGIFYAMEYVEGVDLCQYVRQNGPLSVEDACNYVAQTADALQHACDLELIHRDIKPSNLLLTEPDHTIKLLDLGLTRCAVPIDDSVFVALTRVGTLIGTPDYMSPEQIKDSRNADVRSDLYSLGCTFYYLLTGVAPFEHIDGVVAKLYHHCDREPAPVEELRPGLSTDLAEIVRKLMAKSRRDRFQTPSELVCALESLFIEVNSSAWDTRVEAQAVTKFNTPLPIHRDLPQTETVSYADLGIVVSAAEADLEEADERATPSKSWYSQSLNPAQVIVAVLLATLTLMMLWVVGIGPTIQSVPQP